MGILDIKFDDKISEYFENYIYIQPQNLVITIFFDLELGIKALQFILLVFGRKLCDVFSHFVCITT